MKECSSLNRGVSAAQAKHNQYSTLRWSSSRCFIQSSFVVKRISDFEQSGKTQVYGQRSSERCLLSRVRFFQLNYTKRLEVSR